jgi:hypothetical protein
VRVKKSHWQNLPEIPSYEDGIKPVGFVYQISCPSTSEYYIGKKSFWSKRKGKKLCESDWKEYCSSSKELKQRVREEGFSKWVFEVLLICFSKRDLTYQEVKLQFERNVLEDDMSLNRNIMGRFFK